MTLPDSSQSQPARSDANLLYLLALCPLIVGATSAVTALTLGLALLVVTTIARLLLTLLPSALAPPLRLPLLVLLLAALVTLVELALQAYAWPLRQQLGVFVPLLFVSGLLLLHAEDKHRPLRAATVEGLRSNLVCLLILLIVGALRELLGTGALLPAGAFLLLGLLLALKQTLAKQPPSAETDAAPQPGSKRVRVTGKV